MNATPLVEVSALTKKFGKHEVLKGIDFTISPGTVTAIIGPSGSGKTTILRNLNALDVATSGHITIGNVTLDFSKKVGRREISALRAKSGMVFQAHGLFGHLKVLQNVTVGPVVGQKRNRKEVEAEALELLGLVGLSDKVHARIHELSGGQQQRVGIARALALKPDLLLLDEPTSALDPELVGEVLRAIRNLADAGWTLVIVTHEMQFAKQVADQVLFIDQGLIVERGTAAQVLETPKHPRTREFLARILGDF